MAHGGQELAFGAVGLVGRAPCLLQHLFGLVLAAEVDEQAQHGRFAAIARGRGGDQQVAVVRRGVGQAVARGSAAGGEHTASPGPVPATLVVVFPNH